MSDKLVLKLLQWWKLPPKGVSRFRFFFNLACKIVWHYVIKKSFISDAHQHASYNLMTFLLLRIGTSRRYARFSFNQGVSLHVSLRHRFRKYYNPKDTELSFFYTVSSFFSRFWNGDLQKVSVIRRCFKPSVVFHARPFRKPKTFWWVAFLTAFSVVVNEHRYFFY